MIRPADLSDAADIAAIYNEYIAGSTATFDTDPVSVTEMQGRIAEISAAFPYLVCETGGKVIAYCYAHVWKEKAAYRTTLESTVYVAPGLQKRGTGEALMRKLIEECRHRGFHSLIACITADNRPSIALHEKLGFRKVSGFKEVGMKFGRWLDVEDYQLLL